MVTEHIEGGQISPGGQIDCNKIQTVVLTLLGSKKIALDTFLNQNKEQNYIPEKSGG